MLQDLEIQHITVYSGDSASKASVSFRVGPIIIRGATIFEKNGARWLSMPGRKTVKGDWLDIAYFANREDKAQVQDAVLQRFAECPQGYVKEKANSELVDC